MLGKIKGVSKKVLTSVVTASVIITAVSMPACAQHVQFYTDNLGSYTSGDAPKANWYKTFTGGGTIGKSKWEGTVDQVKVKDVSNMRFGKVFVNNPNQLFRMNYKWPVLDNTNNDYIKLGNGAKEDRDYYIRWTMYLPFSGVNDKQNANLLMAFKSQNTKENDKLSAGVLYNGSQWKPVIRLRSNNKGFVYGTKAIDKGKYYNCFMKISAKKANTDGKFPVTIGLKVYEYGTAEPKGYDVNVDYTYNKDAYDNLITMGPATNEVLLTAMQVFTDFQVDGYSGDDITDAETVFEEAQKINPDFSAIKSQEDLDNAIDNAIKDVSPAADTTVTWTLNTTDTTYLAVENNKPVVKSQPEYGDLSFALTVEVKKGNTVTYKTFPVTLKAAKMSYGNITASRDKEKKVVCSVDVTNNTAKAIKAPKLIVCTYDENGVLVNMAVSASNGDIGAAQQTTVSVTGSANTTGTVKAFLWDNFSALKPVMKDVFSKPLSEVK
ncbi:MAG: hypothetical protein EGR16_06985 [Clostridiales bacterium]|nr:hypothetical protein [Clostridiales bacterium]